MVLLEILTENENCCTKKILYFQLYVFQKCTSIIIMNIIGLQYHITRELKCIYDNTTLYITCSMKKKRIIEIAKVGDRT